jgi:hypothetical protein
MIQTTAVVPDALALSSFAALLAPVVIVAVSAVVVALAGMLVGIVTEWRDVASRRAMTRASEAHAAHRPFRNAA